jgi:ArsR family transcriptional regulator
MCAATLLADYTEMEGRPAFDEKTVADFAEKLKALADPHRLRVLYLLMTRGEMCVCECMLALDLTQSNLSFHLKTLKHAGFINARKSARWVYYSLNREAFERFLAEFARVFDLARWPEGSQSAACETPARERVGRERRAQ